MSDNKIKLNLKNTKIGKSEEEKINSNEIISEEEAESSLKAFNADVKLDDLRARIEKGELSPEEKACRDFLFPS